MILIFFSLFPKLQYISRYAIWELNKEMKRNKISVFWRMINFSNYFRQQFISAFYSSVSIENVQQIASVAYSGRKMLHADALHAAIDDPPDKSKPIVKGVMYAGR